MGSHDYALKMAKLLDPEDVYFPSRVISRDDSCFENRKSLTLVPVQERFVLIMDDTEDVWKNHINNLVLMERYLFFASSIQAFGFPNSFKSLSQRKVDENEGCAALASVLTVLKRVHHVFFEDYNLDRDVREVLKDEKKQVLKGCKIAFCRVFLTLSRNNEQFKHMALQLGAECCATYDERVTHVVATNDRTDESLREKRENKYLVLPKWIETANYLWKKLPEEDYLVPTSRNSNMYFIK